MTITDAPIFFAALLGLLLLLFLAYAIVFMNQREW